MADNIFLLCDCEKTMRLDGKAIGRAVGADEMTIHSHLCRAQIGAYEKAIGSGKAVCVGCTQEAPLFAEIAGEAEATAPTFFNIRENAGWTTSRDPVTAKVAALMAAAATPRTPTRTLTLKSDGLCLVYGSGQAALDAALLLNRDLSVTLLLKDGGDVLLPPALDVPVYCGTLRAAAGHFGAFEVTADNYAPMLPSSKGAPAFAMARNGAKSTCSVVVDLSGDPPLVTRPEGRDGYLRADPGDPAAVMRALFEASALSGEFEKPIYTRYDSGLCVHSRSRKAGCSKCVDNCPAGAIISDGDRIAIDTAICGGCGSCAAHCPTGAISYQHPGRRDLIGTIQAMASAYRAAGGKAPVLLLHGAHGEKLIGAMARLGRGLPANAVPFGLHSTSGVGHDTALAALAAGFSRIVVVSDPRKSGEMDAARAEAELVNTVASAFGLGDGVFDLVETADPDELEERLWSMTAKPSPAAEAVSTIGAKREIARRAMIALKTAGRDPGVVPLPASAPYGRVIVSPEACTLCLACVTACPTSAMRDNPDKPQLRFIEAACVQCGLCMRTCPEKAITLEARLDLSPAAERPAILHEEEPAKCIRCGKPFAAKSSIERIAEKLGGKHWMYETNERVNLIRMCDVCRLEALSEDGGDPFAIAERPRVRTTDDYRDDGES